MGKYTTEVRYICESTAGLIESGGFNSIDKVLSKETVDSIFNFDYPIFDEEYRYPLNKKILQHFYTREIGEETVGLWKLRLCQTLNEIMPYYNKLYKSELDEINPYYNIDITKSGNKTKNSDKTSNSNGTENENTNGNSNKSINTNENGSNNERKTGNNQKTKTINETDKTTDVNNLTKKSTDTKTTNTTKGYTGTSTNTKDNTDVSKTTTNDINTNTDRYSDTPQGGLNGMLSVEQNMYLTNARIIDKNGNVITNYADVAKQTGKENVKSTETGIGTDKYLSVETNGGTANRTINRTGGDITNDNINENKAQTNTKNKTGTENKTDNYNTYKSKNNSSNENINNAEDYIEHISGYKGNKAYAELIMEWRKSFLNIDRMILKDLEDCFFQLW